MPVCYPALALLSKSIRCSLIHFCRFSEAREPALDIVGNECPYRSVRGDGSDQVGTESCVSDRREQTAQNAPQAHVPGRRVRVILVNGAAIP
jgi:hypothetical protein